MVSKEQFEKYHNQFMEDEARQATDEICSTYSNMHDSFERYLDAINCFEFENGFYYALELVNRGDIQIERL